MNEKKTLERTFCIPQIHTHNNNKKNVGKVKQRTSLREKQTLVGNQKNNVVVKFSIQFYIFLKEF